MLLPKQQEGIRGPMSLTGLLSRGAICAFGSSGNFRLIGEFAP